MTCGRRCVAACANCPLPPQGRPRAHRHSHLDGIVPSGPEKLAKACRSLSCLAGFTGTLNRTASRLGINRLW